MTLEAANLPEAAADTVETQWWRRAKAGERSSREALFNHYFPFAKQLARRQFIDRRAGDIEFGDLCQLASAGLLEAIDSFDPHIGTPFKAFARRRVTGSILDGIAKMSEVREQQSFRSRVRRDRVRSLGVSKVEAASMPPQDALQALIDVAMGLALGFMLDETSLYVAGEADTRQPTAYDSLLWKDALRAVAAGIEDLPDQERSVIRTHYVDGLKFEQIAALHGLSKGRISQVHRAALTRLRRRLSAGHFNLTR